MFTTLLYSLTKLMFKWIYQKQEASQLLKDINVVFCSGRWTVRKWRKQRNWGARKQQFMQKHKRRKPRFKLDALKRFSMPKKKLLGFKPLDRFPTSHLAAASDIHVLHITTTHLLCHTCIIYVWFWLCFFMESAKIIVYVTHVDETMQTLIIGIEKLKT